VQVYDGMKRALVLVLIVIAIISSSGIIINYQLLGAEKPTPSAYIGVTFCGNTTSEGKMLLDKVQSYTNLFVIDSIVINKNQTALDELCNYASAKGKHVIVYFGDFNLKWQLLWVNQTRDRLGDLFLGVYYYDEPGGIQLEYNWYNYTGPVPNLINSTRNYDEAASGFITSFQNYKKFQALRNASVTAFTSDFALYWWDYKAGFDVVWTQFGWNSSVNQNIALTRGAAQAQNKSWGVIVTWTYNQPPYLCGGDQIYNEMLLAYQSGAKYITIFNYPACPNGNPYGLLTDEHFSALQKIWNYAVNDVSGANSHLNTADAVLVLPRNYGWGMRNQNDIIWGFWHPDETSAQIWNATQTLLTRYGSHLDIIFDDPSLPVNNGYSNVYYWNQTLN
jgi:hypothetical protein